MGAHPSTPFILTSHQPLSSFSISSTTSSFLSDISPSCPSNANLARYAGSSGCFGGGGGGGILARGGADGGALSLPADDDTTGVCRLADPPGIGCGVGFDRDVACGFFYIEF